MCTRFIYLLIIFKTKPQYFSLWPKKRNEKNKTNGKKTKEINALFYETKILSILTENVKKKVFFFVFALAPDSVVKYLNNFSVIDKSHRLHVCQQ